jgi:oligopeptide transport system ATP-binding protein
MSSKVVLRAENVKMHFPVKNNAFFSRKSEVVKAVDGVSLELYEGECLGLVGESGCGKSTLGRCLVRLYEPTSGSIQMGDKELTHLHGEPLRLLRTGFQIIFQDPFASLDPRMTVFDIVAEPIKTFGLAQSRAELEEKVSVLMNKVGLSPRFIRKYPHEFSGGQRQRIAIARALAVGPKIVICDEPVSALDVSIQAQILNLLGQLQEEFGVSYIFIAHDISAVRHISDRIAVMYLGHIVEIAPRDELFANPAHPYTKALLSAVPVPNPRLERERQRVILKGDLPSPRQPPRGCPFHTRCPLADESCTKSFPSFTPLSEQHKVACFKAL